MEAWDGSRINEKKEILAYSLTSLVHGEEEAEKAKQVSYALFAGKGDDANMPKTELSAADVPEEGLGILELLLLTGLIPSKGEGRRLVQQGGVSLDGEKVEGIDVVVSKAALTEGAVIKKGKKVFHKVIMQ